MKPNQKSLVESHLRDYTAKNLERFGVHSLQVLKYDLKRNDFFHLATEKKWSDEFAERKIIVDAVHFLRQQCSILNHDIADRHKEVTKRNSYDLAITQLTQSGYQEAIFSFRDEPTQAMIHSMKKKAAGIIYLANQHTKNYVLKPIPVAEVVSRRFESDKKDLFSNCCANDELTHFAFGDLVLTKKELCFVRCVTLGYDRNEIATACNMSERNVSKVNQRLQKKTSTSTRSEMMKSLHSLGIVQAII